MRPSQWRWLDGGLFRRVDVQRRDHLCAADLDDRLSPNVTGIEVDFVDGGDFGEHGKDGRVNVLETVAREAIVLVFGHFGVVVDGDVVNPENDSGFSVVQHPSFSVHDAVNKCLHDFLLLVVRHCCRMLF